VNTVFSYRVIKKCMKVTVLLEKQIRFINQQYLYEFIFFKVKTVNTD